MQPKLLLVALALLAAIVPGVRAEDPQPVSTGNPSVSVEELDLMLLPLTQDELVVEADGWMALLKEKVQELSDRKIQALQAGNQKAKAAAKAAEEKAEAADLAKQAEPAAELAAQEVAAEAEAEAKQQSVQKSTALDQINKLNEERVLLIDRLKVVLKALRSKGGDTTSYDTYITAISELKVNWYDPEALYAAFSGWVFSEQGGLRLARNIGLFILVMIIVRFLSGFVGSVVHRALSFTSKHSDLLRTFLVTLARTAVTVFGLVFALQMLEIDITPMIAALGAAGLVIAFALQGTVSNFAAGVMILLYRPFDVGDVVTAGGVTGSVLAMNLVQTKIKTPDNQVLIVPNADIWGGVITNVTGSDTRRVDMVFGIGYGDDIELAKSTLGELLAADPRVLKDPEPMIVVSELADSSVNIATRPWVKTSDYWGVFFDMHEKVKKEFDAKGISIPFPQQDVYMHQPS